MRFYYTNQYALVKREKEKENFACDLRTLEFAIYFAPVFDFLAFHV